jgi:hypothetical protein
MGGAVRNMRSNGNQQFVLWAVGQNKAIDFEPGMPFSDGYVAGNEEDLSAVPAHAERGN